LKTCKGCEVTQDLSNFYQFYDKWTTKYYYSARCKPCHYEQNKNNKNKTKNAKTQKLKLRYGLTYNEWEELREVENHQCMICGISEEELGRVLDVDHCHVSNKVRGVVCNPCNLILANARDDIELLKSAMKYLEDNGDGYGGKYK